MGQNVCKCIKAPGLVLTVYVTYSSFSLQEIKKNKWENSSLSAKNGPVMDPKCGAHLVLDTVLFENCLFRRLF